MTLMSARFLGNPILERISEGDQTAYLRYGSQGDAVRAVQEALIDLDYSIPDGPTGNFLSETSAAVVQFKTDQGLAPTDAVVGQGTITALDSEWAVPFADRDEWLSWQTRPIPEWNFTRQNEFDRRNAGRAFTFNQLSSWLPQPFQDAVVRGVTELLDPSGSPAGALTPSATWGVSPLDLYHCHVGIDISSSATPSWSSLKGQDRAIGERIDLLTAQADHAGDRGTPPWTAAYRNLLLAPAPPGGLSFNDQTASLLNDLHAKSLAENQTLKLLWHTFERGLWRPVDVGSDDLRRIWWSDISPVAGGVSQTPFVTSAIGANFFELGQLGFVIDQNAVITLMAQTIIEAAALVNLDYIRIEAAVQGTPFP